MQGVREGQERSVYCDECGVTISEGAAFCDSCGNPLSAQTDEGWYRAELQPSSPRTQSVGAVASTPYQPARHCGACGQQVNPGAFVCPGCGVPVGPALGAKNKTTAVLLACFLGPWTWVYTYKLDSKKFWIGVIVPGAAFLLFIIASTAFSSSVTDCQYPYSGCSPLSSGSTASGVIALIFFIVGLLAAIGIHIWAIVDSASKNDWYYARFPDR